jgi:hypothetical protein
MDFTIKEKREGKCATCSSGVILQGNTFNERIVHCHALERDVPFIVTECSRYRVDNSQSLWEMEKVAWIIEQKKGSFIGFLSPLDAKKKGIDPHD